MIDGSPYDLVTAINDESLSADDRAAEQRKLEKEIEKRQKESARERQGRVAKYLKDSNRDHETLQEIVSAFVFHLAGQAQMDGHACWILDAEPRPGYEPNNHEGRVLKGMKGRLWIDQATDQWVNVHAEVVRPVKQAPVADGVWFPKALHVRVNAFALGFFSENSTENDTFRDYEPMPRALALLQSTK